MLHLQLTIISETILFFSHGGKKHTRHVIHTNLMCALCISQLIFVFGIEATENRVRKDAQVCIKQRQRN